MRDEELALNVRERADAIAPPLCDDLDRASDALAPRIRVRRECEHAATCGKRLEHRVGLALLVRGGSTDRVHQKHEVGRTDFGMLVIRHWLDRRDSVNRWRPDEMDACCVLAETRNARGTLAACWKVDVRELRDRMAHRLVGDALGTISAVNVCDTDATDRCSACCRKCLDAIAKHDDDIGRKPLEVRCQRGHAATKCCSIGKSTCFARTLHLEPMHAMAA
jgi:hypothetical protein